MTSRSPIESLPPELVQHILSFVPDVTSLLATILTCSSVYNAFIGVEVHITSQLVRNFMDVEVLPEAAAALKSSGLAPWTLESMQKFVDDQLLSRQAPLLSWTLSEALPLNHLHRHVEYFALDFASRALAKLAAPGDTNAMPASSPTLDELYRIQRAFYRFEIYCNLFGERKPPAFEVRDHEDVFFFKFAPWENEQLCCIHDYLFNAVSPGMHHATFVPVSMLTVSAFNEITDHDVAWGASGIEDAFDLDSPYIQHVLSLGLAHLHAVAAAETYDERHRLMYEPFPKSNLDRVGDSPYGCTGPPEPFST
jgi:F-box domain